MTISRRTILEHILERVAEPAEAAEAIFSYAEIRRWAHKAIAELTAARLIVDAPESEMVVCAGCEEYCHRPIYIEGTASGTDTVFSTCHVHPHIGMIEHQRIELSRWTSSRKRIAKFVARSLSLPILEHDGNWRRIRFAAFEEPKAGRRAVSLELNGPAIIKVGSANASLIDILSWNDSGISIDRDALSIVLAQGEDLRSGHKRYQTSTSVRDDRRLANLIRDRLLQRRLESLAKAKPRLSKQQLAKLLEKLPEAKGMTWGRIARVTRMPSKN